MVLDVPKETGKMPLRRRPPPPIAALLLGTLALAGPGCGRSAAAPAEAPPERVLLSTVSSTGEGSPVVVARWGQGTCAPAGEAGRRWLSCATPGNTHPVFLAGRPAGAPLDLRGRFVKTWLRVDGVSRLRSLELRLSSDDFREGFYGFNVPLYADRDFNLLRDGAWFPFTASFGVARTQGAPDRTAIDAVGLYVEDTGAGPVRVEWAGVSVVEQPPAGLVSLTFDDGWVEHAAVAAPEMARLGFRGTAYVMPDAVGGAAFMSEAQLAKLQRDYGWDVAAHHGVPFTDFAPAQLEAEIAGVQRYLRGRGFGPGALHLAYPLGKQDLDVVRPAVRRHFATARIASAGPETLPPADAHLLRAVNVLPTTAPEELGRVAARAREHGEWAILMFHHLVDEPRSDLDYGRREFRAALARIAATGVEVLPVSEVWERLGSPGPAPAAPDLR
jgi:peptidoglycan/xylan/chitin deacetylase (PgdA/CDA1 family)